MKMLWQNSIATVRIERNQPDWILVHSGQHELPPPPLKMGRRKSACNNITFHQYL